MDETKSVWRRGRRAAARVARRLLSRMRSCQLGRKRPHNSARFLDRPCQSRQAPSTARVPSAEPTAVPSPTGAARRPNLANFRHPPADAAGRMVPVGARELSAHSTSDPDPVGFRWPPSAAAGQLVSDGMRRPANLVHYPRPLPDLGAPPLSLLSLPRDLQQLPPPEPNGPSPAAAAGPEAAGDVPPRPESSARSDAQSGSESGPSAYEQSTVLDQPDGHRPSGPERRRVLVVTTLILTLLVAGSVALPFSLRYGRGSSSHGGTAAASASASAGQADHVAAAARQAVEWISQHVSRSAIVACDPSTCSALAARGIPAANLLVLRTATASLLHAKLVLVTPTVRSQFGSRLSHVLAPSVIARFGSGADLVTVQVTAPDGPSAYNSALSRDVADRKSAGAHLLANGRIELSAEARTQLADGQVDSRILMLLPMLAATHPIQVLAFGDPGPGASPGIALCSADLSGSAILRV